MADKRESFEERIARKRAEMATKREDFDKRFEEHRESVENPKFGDITLKIDVDVSEALTGLKALQREAKEATKALRELEKAQEVPEHVKKYSEHYSWKSTGENGLKSYFSDVPTKTLAEELAKRNGVESVDIEAKGINVSTFTINWHEIPE